MHACIYIISVNTAALPRNSEAEPTFKRTNEYKRVLQEATDYSASNIRDGNFKNYNK